MPSFGRPITHPPEPMLRAYTDLLTRAIVFIRNTCLSPEGIDPQMLFDLADALHNIPDILLDYGRWTDDAKYRAGYLRPFDEKWSQRAFSLEEFVQTMVDEYRRNPPSG